MSLPTRRVKIYEKAINYMMYKWRPFNKRRIPEKALIEDSWIDAKLELLEYLAYQFSCEGKDNFSMREISKKIREFKCGTAFENATVPDIITELSAEDGIFQKLSPEDESYIFLHRTFQEYLTASYLNRTVDGLKIIRKYFWDYDWHETIVLFANIAETPIPLLKSLIDEKDDIFSTLLLLAGKCLAESEEKTDPMISDILARIIILWESSSRFSFIYPLIEQLAKTYKQVFENLLQFIVSNKNTYIRGETIQLLKRIGNQKAIPALLQILHNQQDDKWLRQFTASALKALGDECILQDIFYAIPKEDSNAQHILKILGQEPTVEQLIQSLLSYPSVDSFDISNRFETITSLKKMTNNKQAIELLIQALYDKKCKVRSDAVSILSEIAKSQAIENALQALKENDDFNRMCAIEALKELQGEEAIDSLIQALQDADSKVRASAINQLAELKYDSFQELTPSNLEKINNEATREILLQFLKDHDPEVRIAAIKILDFDCERVIEALIQAVQDEDVHVRWQAQQRFHAVISPYFEIADTSVLLRFLHHESSHVRVATVEALGKLVFQKKRMNEQNPNELIIKLLIESLQDTDAEVRGRAGVELGFCKEELAIEPLLTLLKDQDAYVRACALWGLKYVGNEQAIVPIIQMLHDTDWEVKQPSIEALDWIGNKEAIQPLIEILYDINFKSLREEIVTALRNICQREEMIEQLEIPLLDIFCEAEAEDELRELIIIHFKEFPALQTLENFIKHPGIDIYRPDTFHIVRELAIRFSQEISQFIPVYPELLNNKRLEFQIPPEMRFSVNNESEIIHGNDDRGNE